MNNFYISNQTEAEKDAYLIDSFHDAGFIEQLTSSGYSFVAGRKGAGKTALAKYLEKKGAEHGIAYAYRISVRSIGIVASEKDKNRSDSVLFFILVKVIQKLLEIENFFQLNQKEFWNDFLVQNGLQSAANYEKFIEITKKEGSQYDLTAALGNLLAKIQGRVAIESGSEYAKANISNIPSALFDALKLSLSSNIKIYFFIDDITDHLDGVPDQELKEEISHIQHLLLNLSGYNNSFSDDERGLRFITLVRDDLFDFMEGSNINKLRHDTLWLKWDEKSFASLLIRRLPFYQSIRQESLKDPIEAIRSQFPDEIFSNTLEKFETRRYQTNFYAYMVAISFNRPRDFLMYCYALRDRLSLKHPVEYKNIESAEIEYSDYFAKELKDELFLISRLFKYNLNTERLAQLIDILSRKEGFNSSQLHQDFARYLSLKTSIGKKKIEMFMQELWRYGVLGFRGKNMDDVISFNYTEHPTSLLADRIKEYIFYLHRGLWWFSKKRRQD